MLRVRICAVGRLRESGYRAAAEEYAKRLRSYCRLEVVEVEPSHRREPARLMSEEGQRLLRGAPGPTRRIASHGAGRTLDSMAFARLIGTAHDGGESISFLIGGTEGLSPEVLDSCQERISLSRLTFPHELARVILLEQVYRAFRILRGEPYHR